MEHTPTPWKINDQTASGWMDNAIYIVGATGENLVRVYHDTGNAPENAAHIVKCVNLHESLFEALELLIDNIPSEAWESLPPYVEQKIMEAFNAAKDAEAAHA